MNIDIHKPVLAISLAACGAPAAADAPIPVRLQVAGVEVRGSVPALWDGREWHAPLEVLPIVGLDGELRRGRDEFELRGGSRGAVLRLSRTGGQPRLLLSDLARVLEAEIRHPARKTKDGVSAPVKPGDWVFLLARVRSVRVEAGAVRVETSFPVPVRADTDEAGERPRESLEYVGATLSPGFTPGPVPADERRIAAVTVEQVGVEVARVSLDLVNPDCGRPEASDTPPAQPLRLPDFLRQVQAFYPKLNSADAQRRAAAAKQREKEGAFDPRLYSGGEVTTFPSSEKPAAVKSFTTSEAGVEFMTPYGIKVITGGRLHRGDVKSPLAPTGQSGEYFVGVKVPILGGAGINEKSAELRRSRLGVPLADTEYEEARLEVLLKAAVSYWDWVAAGQRVKVARDLLGLAQVRAGAVKDRADAGDLPLIDVVEANQEVQRRVEGLEKAQRDLQKETFKLSLFTWEADGRPSAFPSAQSIPKTPPPAGELKAAEIEEGRSSALERRPELRALAVSRQMIQVSLDLAQNQRLPAVELSLVPGLDTGVGGAGGTVKAGLSVALPLRQRTAEGRLLEAELKLEKLDLDAQLERQRVLTEVDDAVSAVRQSHARYLAAERELELARRLEQGERERFALGDSTLFLINQRERATAEAAVKVINLQAEYEQSIALFRAVTVQL